MHFLKKRSVIKFVLLLTVVIFPPLLSAAENLKLRFTDKLPGYIERNVRAHLGDLPQSTAERTAFIYSTQKTVNQSLQALGYYRAVITTTVDKENPKIWQLNLAIALGEPTTIENIDVDLAGDALVDESFLSLVRNVKLKRGDRLDHGKYEQIKLDLTTLGLDRGYFLGKIAVSTIKVHESLSSANIKIIYDSGKRYKFGDVHFNEFDIDPELLLKVTPFEKGEYFTTEKLYDFQNKLQQTQFFGSAVVVPDRTQTDAELLPINVSLAKAKSHYFDMGVGYSTDKNFRYSVGWRTPLINKYGHRQETKIEFSQVNPKGRFLYSIPLSHPINDLLQLQLTANDDKYGDLTSFYIDTKAANLRIYKRWSGHFYIRRLQEAWDIETTSHNARFTLPGITISKTSKTGKQLDPSWGFSQVYTIEGGNTNAGSDINIVRLYGRWRYIASIAPKHRFVVRTEAGASIIDQGDKDSLPPSLRFYAGGDQSMRGFAYQSLGTRQTVTDSQGNEKSIVVGGTRLLIGSLEYQYYFTDEVRGIVFTDAGNAFDKDQYKPAYSIGTGAHYISPIGPIRLDVGYSISEVNPDWRVHISLGTEL